MKNFAKIFFQTIVVATLVFIFNNCTRWDESTVEIERFEYLDSFYSDSLRKNSLLVEAYLIHDYNKKYDDKIQVITDRYVCDSIIPNSTFYRARYITFFKKTKNTNRENFQVRPKHKNIYARSRDKLFSYRIKERDSVNIRIRKIYEAYDTEISFKDFHCE